MDTMGFKEITFAREGLINLEFVAENIPQGLFFLTKQLIELKWAIFYFFFKWNPRRFRIIKGSRDIWI